LSKLTFFREENSVGINNIRSTKNNKVTIKSDNDFDQLSEQERSNYIRIHYNKRCGEKKYATSPDFNLKELEIDFILSNIRGTKILDLGCGNGYTLIRIAEKINAELIGIDFSSEMINGANQLLNKFESILKCKPHFSLGDATTFIPPEGKNSINTVITERFLLNLPSEKIQHNVIQNIHSILCSGGQYIMIEGSKDGLLELNKLRKIAELEPIPDRAKDNLSSRKFDDNKLIEFLSDYFEIVTIMTFDLYYIISRVIYPKIIYPNIPKYDHPVNKIARDLERYIDLPSKGIGHVKGYVLNKR